MEHTKGPWEVIPQNGAGPIIAHKFDTGNQMNPSGLRLVCHVLMRGDSMMEDLSNSILIASAPELLAKLKELVDACDGNYRELIEECNAAIAKAEVR